jgi:hypothetical protein
MIESDLHRLVDLVIDSLEVGVVKTIVSRPAYRARLKESISLNKKSILNSNCIMKYMEASLDLLPRSKYSGEVREIPTLKGAPSYSMIWTTNDEIKNILKNS